MTFHRPATNDIAPFPVASPAAATVFTTLIGGPPMPRVELARVVGLSAAAVTRVVRPLLDLGYLVETASERSDLSVGRPVSPLRVVADRQFFIGVKITATELIGVLTDLQAHVRAVRHVKLDSSDVETVVPAIAGLTAALRSDSPVPEEWIGGLGVGVTGDIDRVLGIARESPFLGWRNVPLAQMVANATGLPTVVDNDVRALTLAEKWFGAGVGVKSFALVTIGTGIGCGLYMNNEIVRGAHGVAGEIGHLPLVSGDRLCTCGRSGCVETLASASAVLQDIQALPRPGVESMKDAVALAHAGDHEVRGVFDRAGVLIGRALAVITNIVGPKCIILSAEGMEEYELYDARIRESFREHSFGSAAECELIVRPLSSDAWARGAAVGAIESFVRSRL